MPLFCTGSCLKTAVENLVEFFFGDFRDEFAAVALEDFDDLAGFVEICRYRNGLPVEFVAVVEGSEVFLDHFFGCLAVESLSCLAPFDDVSLLHRLRVWANVAVMQYRSVVTCYVPVQPVTSLETCLGGRLFYGGC